MNDKELNKIIDAYEKVQGFMLPSEGYGTFKYEGKEYYIEIKDREIVYAEEVVKDD